VTDEEALPLISDLLKQEGFCMGGSTAINIAGMYVNPNLPTLSPLGFIQATLGEHKTDVFILAGAIKLAKELGPGHTIVTILCDLGTRYQSKVFNVEFLKSKGLPYPEWLDAANQDTTSIPEVFEQVE
jgi:cysteine synthase A